MLPGFRRVLPIFVKNGSVGGRSIFLGAAACSERVRPPSGVVCGGAAGGVLSNLTTTVSPPSPLRHPTTSTLSPPSLLSLPRTRLLHTTTVWSTDSSLVVDDGEKDRLYSLVDVECRGHEPAVLRSYLTFIFTAATHLGITVENVAWPKMHIERWTLLKSVHIHKKHRVQYEARTHFLTLSLPRLTGSTADTYLEYIQRNLPEGVAMKVTKHELQTLPPHVKPSPEVSA